MRYRSSSWKKPWIRAHNKFGYAGNYWTLDELRQVIWQLFGIRYHPSAVGIDGSDGLEQSETTAVERCRGMKK